MKLHVAVQQVVNELIERLDELPDVSEIEALIQTELESRGFVEDDVEFGQVAKELVTFFVESKSNLPASAAEVILLPIPGGNISVTPDQLLKKDGSTMIRRVKTGHKFSSEENSLETAVLEIAAQSCSTNTTAQFVHLGDQTVTDVALTDRKLKNRKNSLAKVGESLRAGEYPLSPNVTCPRCPAYFVCGQLTKGELTKNISD